MRPTKNAFLSIMITAFVALGASCNRGSPSDWYPSGQATVVSHYEATEGGARTCLVTLKIENTGLSKIAKSTVSLPVLTDKKTYLKTLVSNMAILPGKAVYETAAVAYAEAAETTAIAKITIAGEFYE